MRGRELGDKRTQPCFHRLLLVRRLEAAGDLDVNFCGTASRGFFLHAHKGSLELSFCCKGCAASTSGPLFRSRVEKKLAHLAGNIAGDGSLLRPRERLI